MNRVRLIICCGIPGSGKTTYVEKCIKQYGGVHLSSDLIRKELYGDESIQGDPNEVFSLMQSRAVENLNNGIDVYYDATNITRKDRAGIIALCPKFVQIECHVIWASIEACIERDAARDRTVGQAVIDKMLKRFQPPFYDEGIDEIKVVFLDDFNKADYTDKVMNAMKVPHDNPHHTLNIHDHCVKACECTNKFGVTIEVALAALIHDVGKPYVKSFKDSKGNISEMAHFYQHQCVSAWMSYGIQNVTPFTAWLVGAHMEPFFESKYYKKLPAFLRCDIDILHKCDLEAH